MYKKIFRNEIYFKLIYIFILFFLSSAITISTLYYLEKNYVPILFWDQWDDIRHYIAFINGSFHFSELFDQHNEHRLFFPRLIFFTDFYFFKGAGFFVVILTLIIQTLHALLLSLLYKLANPNKNKIVYALPFAVIFMLSLGQEDNFISAFQIEFAGVGLAASLSFISFIKALDNMKNGRSYWRYELGAYIAVTIATYSIANGILSALVLILIAVSVSRNKLIILRIIFVFFILSFAYFINYTPPAGGQSYTQVFVHPFLYLQYVCYYLGNIFNALLSPAYAQFQTPLGAIGLIATLFVFGRLVSGRERNSARVVLSAIILFAAGTAMLTSLGRVTLGLVQANDSRYLTQTSIFWICHIFYCNSFLSEANKSKYYFIPLHLFSLLAVAGTLQAHIAGSLTLKAHAHTLGYASTALMSDVDALETFRNLHPYPQKVVEVSSFLRDHGLSIFSTREAKSLGRPIAESYRLSDSSGCSGSIDLITGEPPNVSPPNWVANGWAWNDLKRKPVDRVVLTSQSGIVIGFAAGGWPPPFLSNVSIKLPKGDIGWRGFLKASDNDSILAYALLSNGSACRFGQSAPSRNYLIPVSMEEVGAVIDVPFRAADAWTVNGQYPFIEKLPLGDVIYGSWSGKEKNIGEMVAGPLTISADPLLIPIVTGPRIDGLHIRITEPDTGAILAVYALPVTMNWHVFKFGFPKELIGRSVNITMSDQGNEWGEWFGVGAFHSSSHSPH